MDPITTAIVAALSAQVPDALTQSAEGRAALSKYTITMEDSQVGVIREW